MKIKAMVAVRSGSVRVANKNLRPFAGSTLLHIKLEQLKRISVLDGIIVNSEDEEMLKIARDMGCEAIKREVFFSSNTVSMSEVYKHMAENFTGDVVMYTNVTNPLLKDETIYKAIETYKTHMDLFDSLNTASLIKEFLFKDNLPMNYSLDSQPRSQDLPDIFALNFAINIIAKEIMIQRKNVIGFKPKLFQTDEIESTDIDTPIDFEFAEFCYKNLYSTTPRKRGEQKIF